MARKPSPQTNRAKPAGTGGQRPSAPRRPAQDWPISTCDCDACRKACLNSPGWFLPGQLEPLAAFLKLPLPEVFRKYLAVGTTVMAAKTLRQGVMPHKLQDHKKPGSVWSLAEIAREGRCVFFDRGKCAIYPVRPFECSRALHSRPDRAVALRRHVAGQWTSADLKPYLDWAARRRAGVAGPERERP